MPRRPDVDLGRGYASLPAWAGGRGVEQLCRVTCGHKSIALVAEEGPWWATGWEWPYTESIEIEERDDEVVLIVKHRIKGESVLRLLDVDAAQVETAIGPYRGLLNSAPPPPSLEELEALTNDPLPDVLFETEQNGIQVWFSDVLAHDNTDRVDAYVEWARTYRGVEAAWREDTELVIAHGDFSHRSFKRDTRSWWRREVPALTL